MSRTSAGAALIHHLGKPLRLVFGHKSLDHLVESLAGYHLVQLVEGEVDAVVGHASLREIVGPDPLGAVAGADLALSRGGAFGLKPGAFGVIQPRAQDLHRLGAVLVLGFLVLLADHDAGRDMGDPHRESVVFTDCPPGPEARNTSIRRSLS